MPEPIARSRFRPSIAGRALVAFAMVTWLSGCAHAPEPAAPPEAVHPRSIAIIPVARAENITINRRSYLFLLGGLSLGLERADRYNKQQSFEQRLTSDRDAVARQLTDAMLTAAQRRGYNAVVLDHIVRNPDEPEEFDYPNIPTDADVIVHVRIPDIGLLNLFSSLDYEPYVDTKVYVVSRTAGFEMLDERFYYGINGAKGDPYSIAADPADRWPDFDAVMTQADAVEKSWMKGANALGERIVAKLPAPAAH